MTIHVVYVAGDGRSGSTLLDRILGQFPGICAVGEVRYLWRRGAVEDERCGCGHPFSTCPFWTSVMDRVSSGGTAEPARRIAERAERLDRSRNLPLLAAPLVTGSLRADLQRHTDLLSDLYRAVRDEAGTSWVVDSSKQASYALLLRRVPGLRVHVLHLVRDSRAVTYSRRRTKQRVESATPSYMPRVAPRTSAYRWLYQNAAVEPLRFLAATYRRVSYEDLVGSPAEEVRSALQACGYPGPIDVGFLADEVLDLRPTHGVSGNPDRFRASTRLRLDDEWRRRLDRRSFALVTSMTAPLLMGYGYRLGRGVRAARTSIRSPHGDPVSARP